MAAKLVWTGVKIRIIKVDASTFLFEERVADDALGQPVWLPYACSGTAKDAAMMTELAKAVSTLAKA